MESATKESVIGEKNIVNSGSIIGDSFIERKETIIIINMMDERLITKFSEAVDTLNNISKSQIVLSEAILTSFRAAENNSLANVNLSKSLLEDKELMRRLMNLLESYTDTTHKPLK